MPLGRLDETTGRRHWLDRKSLQAFSDRGEAPINGGVHLDRGCGQCALLEYGALYNALISTEGGSAREPRGVGHLLGSSVHHPERTASVGHNSREHVRGPDPELACAAKWWKLDDRLWNINRRHTVVPSGGWRLTTQSQ